MSQHQGVPHPLRLLPAHLGQVEPQVMDRIYHVKSMQLLPAVGALHQHLVGVEGPLSLLPWLLPHILHLGRRQADRLRREDRIAIVIGHLHTVSGDQGGEEVLRAALPVPYIRGCGADDHAPGGGLSLIRVRQLHHKASVCLRGRHILPHTPECVILLVKNTVELAWFLRRSQRAGGGPGGDHQGGGADQGHSLFPLPARGDGQQPLLHGRPAAFEVGGQGGPGLDALLHRVQHGRPVGRPEGGVLSRHRFLVAGALQIPVGGPGHPVHQGVEPVEGPGEQQEQLVPQIPAAGVDQLVPKHPVGDGLPGQEEHRVDKAGHQGRAHRRADQQGQVVHPQLRLRLLKPRQQGGVLRRSTPAAHPQAEADIHCQMPGQEHPRPG